MKRHYRETKAQRQANWLAEFSDAVLAVNPSLSGRIDWDTATHLMFSGMAPKDAAARYLASLA